MSIVGKDGKLLPESEAMLRKHLRDHPKQALGMHSPPPWKQFPEYDRLSLGWRMGPGEDYRFDFAQWFRGLPADQRRAYAAEHPEPADWVGFYVDICGDDHG
jgi:hypothetical protein